MKRILLSILFIFSVIGLAYAVNPANLIRESVESKDLGNNNDTIAEFKLGHVNFLTDNSGSSEYKNGWIRNSFEWCLYRSFNNGPLLVKADSGYWIKDITFYYSDCKSGGMLADTVGAGQKKIAAYDSAKAIVVNRPEKQFYVGKTSTGNGGYLSITKFAVTYCKTPDSLSLEDLIVKVGETFQITPQIFPAGTDAIYSWRSGNTNVASIDQNGVLSAKDTGEVTIWVSADALTDSCQIRVMPDSSVSVVETFSRCTVEKNYSGTTPVIGDKGLYRWKVTNYQRVLAGTEDKVNDSQGIRVRYNGSIATDSIQEGGIKAIAFDWRTPNSSNIINYRVNVGGKSYNYNSEAIKSTTVSHFARQFEVKENTTLSFDMADKIGSTGQAYVIVGPVSITPYLLFTPANHRDTISMGTSGTYDLNRVLINNTDTLPQFRIMSNTTGATDTIIDGVLTITGKKQRGEITIRASWNEDKVSTTLILYVENMPDAHLVETFSNCRSTEMFEGRVHVVGDNGIYDWSVARFQRKNPDDLVADEQGIRVRYDGSIASIGAQEGGVKAIAFNWRTTGPDNPVHFFVQVDSIKYEYSSDSIPVTTVMHYIRPCSVTKNATIRISVPSKENPVQSYIIVGPIRIAPYLLFTAPYHTDTLRMTDTTSYDLYDHLIDNTDSIGLIQYEIVSDATGAASLDGSIITMGDVQESGPVEVKATWGEVTTTMTLFVQVSDPSGISPTPYPLHFTPYTKIIQNGQIRICRGSECYTILGQPIN